MPTVSSGMNNAGNDTAAFNQNVAVSQPVTSMEISSPATPGSWSSSIHQASSNSPGAASSTTSGSALARARLQELVKEVDSNEQLDEEVEDALLSTADMFIDSVVDSACRLAKHRGSSCLEASDLQFVLEHQWGMWLPGFGAEIKPYKKSASAEAHKQRMAIIRKTLKK
ncbi:unnamed protein product [Cyprideis torosa]|uniref:Transcription initiation factor TFIID subunit 12 n=1 Tax=Cyprideis torosa TaxID=163714 RepID=A0A7R8WKK5_9CRUS|nr:unnamed protein product [Cyprideis torosa]CAG0897068.1 unnamed protein product [Cyprideis torosa]